MTTDVGVNIGVSGHQRRPGIDWDWVAAALRSEIVKADQIAKAFSSLAVGSDQVFADVAIGLAIAHVAILPLEGYERYFDGKDLVNYRRLLSRSQRVQLKWSGDPQRAFFEAGKYVVQKSKILFAVWDGEPSDGLGGTADIVEYAETSSCKIIQIDPVKRRIRRGIAEIRRPDV
jgi:hypothetical protein